MVTPRSYVATAPLDVLARALMDQGYSLAPRDDTHHEYARLASSAGEITIYRCGCVWCEGDRAARLLCTMAGGK